MEFEKDYYAILNIPQKATTSEIQQAYRKLARLYHPDVNQEPEAAEKFQTIQEAYETLSDPAQREKYKHGRIQAGFDKPAALKLKFIPSHYSLSPMPEEQAYYALLNITANDNLASSRLPLNLCLVLDRSTSMRGLRLQKVKEAVLQIIKRLEVDDALSLVVFSDRAELLLSSQRKLDKAKANSVISTITPGGGTEILPALITGLKEITSHRSEDSVNHLILLTDGQTYGDEQDCLEQAIWAGRHQINLTTVGIGTDWNEDLLDQMAASSGGVSIYIDSPDKIKNIFRETMRQLEQVIARKLTLSMNLNTGVNLHEAYQITPQISQLERQGNLFELGPLSTNEPKSLLLEFHLQLPNPGQHRLMRLKVEGSIPNQPQYRSWETVELYTQVDENAEPSAEVSSPLANILNKLSIFKMQEKVMIDLQEQQIDLATRRLELIATRLLNMGEEKLAQAALLEAGRLAKTGHLSPEGRKKIRYETRTLTVSLKESPSIPTLEEE